MAGFEIMFGNATKKLAKIAITILYFAVGTALFALNQSGIAQNWKLLFMVLGLLFLTKAMRMLLYLDLSIFFSSQIKRSVRSIFELGAVLFIISPPLNLIFSPLVVDILTWSGTVAFTFGLSYSILLISEFDLQFLKPVNKYLLKEDQQCS